MITFLSNTRVPVIASNANAAPNNPPPAPLHATPNIATAAATEARTCPILANPDAIVSGSIFPQAMTALYKIYIDAAMLIIRSARLVNTAALPIFLRNLPISLEIVVIALFNVSVSDNTAFSQGLTC